MDNGASVLIAAISGRALAASARRGGYLPLVTDFFGDQDTLDVAQAHVRLAGDLARGIEEDALVHALDTLSRGCAPLGIVCGTGFEDRTQLLARVEAQWRLLGNGAQTVAKVKNPQALSALCSSLDLPFPTLSVSGPAESDGWLVKRKGGAGGTHVRPAPEDQNGAGPDLYFQRKMPGTPISALFLADGRRATVLGFSSQWALPTQRQPYRYGGAVRPAILAEDTEKSLAAAVGRLAEALSLVGLNSADFLVDGASFCLLEINPRPGATLDIFEPPQGSLFAMHIDACSGRLPAATDTFDGAKAAAIVYAEDEISVPALEWPSWTADRPLAGSTIRIGEPLCTVHACGAGIDGARTLADERREKVLAWMRPDKS
jgi:predicted ATP-grasp superfamily ATP-dependent carboligase